MTAQQQRAIEAFRVRNYYGLGDTTQQGDAATVASSLQQSAGAVALVNPIAGAAVEVASAIARIVSLFGPNPFNTYATEVVNQVEMDVMNPNLAGWQALPDAEKTLANQQAFEQNFQSGWNYVLSACNNPQLGSAGTNCIGDRQRGGKFDWFKLYYDPIANDPAPAANAAAAAAAAQSAAAAGGTTSSTDAATGSAQSISTPLGSFSPVLLIGLGIIALAFMVSD